MSSRLPKLSAVVAMAAFLVLPTQVLAQSDDADAEMRIQRLENQLRQLTGQNEELQYRNRQLEERLRQLGAGVPAPGAPQPREAAIRRRSRATLSSRSQVRRRSPRSLPARAAVVAMPSIPTRTRTRPARR